jgi:DNA-binding NarL/FixJ family response regulator
MKESVIMRMHLSAAAALVLSDPSSLPAEQTAAQSMFVAATPAMDEGRLEHIAQAYVELHGLSQREGEVFTRFVLEGKASKVIAADLGIADTTVRLYWTRICKKLRCDTAIEAMLSFLRTSVQACPCCELSARHSG